MLCGPTKSNKSDLRYHAYFCKTVLKEYSKQLPRSWVGVLPRLCTTNYVCSALYLLICNSTVFRNHSQPTGARLAWGSNHTKTCATKNNTRIAGTIKRTQNPLSPRANTLKSGAACGQPSAAATTFLPPETAAPTWLARRISLG